MGSSSHAAELAAAAPAIAEVLARHPHVRFETVGCPLPEILADHTGRTRRYGQVDYARLPALLYELGWDVGLVPLFDCEFNRCKTFTKFLEYTAAGIATVASTVGMYACLPSDVVRHVDGSVDSWAAALCDLVENPRKAQALVRRSRAYCRRAHSPAAAADQLWDVYLRTVGQCLPRPAGRVGRARAATPGSDAVPRGVRAVQGPNAADH